MQQKTSTVENQTDKEEESKKLDNFKARVVSIGWLADPIKITIGIFPTTMEISEKIS